MLAAAAVAVVVAGGRTPGYDPARDTISVLASNGQPHALLVRAAIAVAALAVAVSALASRAEPFVARASLLVAATAGLVVATLPKDLPDHAPDSIASQVHVAAAAVGATAIILAMVATRTATSLVAALCAAVLAVVFVRTWGTPVHGAAERALVAVPLVWIAFGRSRPAAWRSPSKA